jgi:GDSL-like Lipase/Acylhydrolase family
MSRRETLLALIGSLIAVLASAEPSQAGWKGAPVIPKLEGHTRANVLATLARGGRLGNRPDVFAKVGDSLTQSATFAQPLGCGRWTAGAHRGLTRTVRRYAERRLPGTSSYCRPVNSFSRNSAAALARQTSYWPLQRGASPDPSCRAAETPLACEIRRTRPAFALILLGSNDVALALALGRDPLPGFIANMRRMVRRSRALGVVPVLTTIPPQSRDEAENSVERLNAALHRLAARRGVALLNLWRVLAPLPNAGLAADGLHLSVYGGPGCVGPCDPNTCAPACEPANFTTAGLGYGADARNLVTAVLLRRLSRLQPPSDG